jgi:hypothetical protein
VPVEPVPSELAGNQSSKFYPTKPAPKVGGGAASAAGLRGVDPAMYPALGTDTLENTVLRPAPISKILHGSARPLAITNSHEKNWSIPGTDGIPDQSCGQVIKWIACGADPTHWKRPLVDHCDRVECPVCWTYWGMKQSKRMADRLRGYVDSSEKQGFAWHKTNAQNLRHWVFSPPEGTILPEMQYQGIKNIAKAQILDAGATGGVYATHLWRIREEIKTDLLTFIKSFKLSEEEREKKFWQCAREDVLQLGSWREYCYWSPHFHVVGFGYLENSRELHSRTGWVYKLIRNVRIQKERKPDGVDDQIAALCFYIISHAAYQWQKKIPSWFGCCTPRNLKKDGDPVPSEFDGMKLVCPKCQAYIVEYQDDGGKIGMKKLTDPENGPPKEQGHWDESHREIVHTIRDTEQKYKITKELYQNANTKIRIRKKMAKETSGT